MLFEVKEVDKKTYKEQFQDFLPGRLIDIHTHILLKKHKIIKKSDNRTVKWPSLVAEDNSIEDLQETYRLMFPGKQVTPMIFTTPELKDNIHVANDYVKNCAEKYHLPALILSLPQWSAEELEDGIINGGFLGSKVYLSLSEAYIPREEIRIFDFLPHHQLEVLNKNGWIVMLHLPRDQRLKDPVNIAQMLEIENRYPNVKLIIAHVGRAYCPEDVGDAFEILGKTKNIMFDFSANTNAQVFGQLIQAVGAKRIMFGSDMPILRMRMRRICENGAYVNLVPKGLYGDVSDDKNMREVEPDEAEKLTFFMYEEIKAFRQAAENTGLTREDIEDIFYNNAKNLIEFVNKTVKGPCCFQ